MRVNMSHGPGSLPTMLFKLSCLPASFGTIDREPDSCDAMMHVASALFEALDGPHTLYRPSKSSGMPNPLRRPCPDDIDPEYGTWRIADEGLAGAISEILEFFRADIG